MKSRYSKDLFAEGVETIRAILEQGQEEVIFNGDLDVDRAAVILYSMINQLLSHDPNTYRKKNREEYIIDLNTVIHLLREGLLYRG
ncbi:hypothetical protein ES703_54800 [subsurface metagenome]